MQAVGKTTSGSNALDTRRPPAYNRRA